MPNRTEQLDRLDREDFDALIIGGGINGAVSAAALASHGARVGLIDTRDFAGFTSQHSSNLVWGGIKYMENYEFPLVAGLCRSRNDLMDRFPSTVQEIRFLTTVPPGFRHHPRTLWAGAWLYWLMGRGRTRAPRYLGAQDLARIEPTINRERCAGALEYSDAYLHDNDARFVFRFVRLALHQGLAAGNYVECTSAKHNGDRWEIDALDRINGRRLTIKARVLINAAGAFVDPLNKDSSVTTRHRHALSKGVHLIVPRVTEGNRVLAFFADDGRLFFAIPMAHRTCIGTTDTRVSEAETGVTDEDREFILSNINARLNLSSPLTVADIISERCGVRPLAVEDEAGSGEDFLQLSRKHVLEVNRDKSQVSIFGGKLTDCLNVGREVCEHTAELGVALKQVNENWYGSENPAVREDFDRRARQLGLHDDVAQDTEEALDVRLWRRYGSDAGRLLDRIEEDPACTRPALPGTGLRVCELSHMRDHELVVTLEDVLRRRSKLELLYGKSALGRMPELKEAAVEVFGPAADRQLGEYLNPGPIDHGEYRTA